jgi:beta-aspartyl-peptidase (threonine type)
MLIIGTSNSACGIMTGIRLLEDGASAVEAVEAVLRAVEDCTDDDSVGPGGLPNLLGETEQDASIMDGAGLRAGAVGALKGYRHPISLARKVMELLPHVMLVGQGASLFAEEIGAEPAPVVSASSRAKYEERMRDAGILDELLDPARARPLRELLYANLGYHPGGTSNVIAHDRDGHICAGVTTSGWAFKYPGRLGDSPIIGAGNYADDRYGGVACTGLGEVTMRLCTARVVVSSLAAGLSLEEATAAAVAEMRRLPVGLPFGINVLAMDAEGHHAMCSTDPRDATYIAVLPGDIEPCVLPAR